jgi:hypothetical protein
MRFTKSNPKGPCLIKFMNSRPQLSKWVLNGSELQIHWRGTELFHFQATIVGASHR